MPDPKQLPFLLKLLDDESPDVRQAVLSQFAAFGDSLEEHLRGLALPQNPQQRRLVGGLIRLGRRKRLKDAWPALAQIRGDKQLLENALALLAGFLEPSSPSATLTQLLDALAAEFRDGPYRHDALALAEFLFQTRRLVGARDSYFNPQNSNLLFVLTHRQGLPISLACVYILIASRLGMGVQGCNLPGHFLALALHEGGKFVVDCFNGGVVLLDSDLARLSSATPVSTTDLAGLECDAPVIITRVLRNLANAYRRLEDEHAADDASTIEELLQRYPAVH